MKIDPVEIWLSKVEKRHSRNDYTERNYRWQLDRFCDFVGSNPMRIVEEWKAAKYDLKAREHYIDELLEKTDVYEHHLGKQGLCKNTIRTYLAGVQSFFKYMRIPVEVDVYPGKPAFHNRDVTKEELKQILDNSTPRDRAFYLMMIQSGLRPITLTRLTYAQIKTDFEAERIPCLIDVLRNLNKGEYTKHFSFMGQNAVDALKAYFHSRGTPSYNERIFVGVKSAAAFSMRFGYYVRKLGLIRKEDMRPGRKPQVLRLYCLRKYFRKMAGAAGQDFAKFWMGETLGVDDHYFSRDPEHHREIYEKKAMPLLRIIESSALETEQTIMELRSQLAALREELQKRPKLDPLLQEIEQLSRLPGYREVFADVVEYVKTKFAEQLKQQKIE